MNCVAMRTTQLSARAFHTRSYLSAATSATPTVTAAPRSAPLRSKLTAFLVGVGVASLFGYYRLQTDVWHSAEVLESQVRAVQTELDASRALRKQVSDLQARVHVLESRK